MRWKKIIRGIVIGIVGLALPVWQQLELASRTGATVEKYMRFDAANPPKVEDALT